MRSSIRNKLFIIISGLILFYVLLSWTLNSLLLEKYYFYNRKNTLMDSYKLIDSIYKGNMEEAPLELEKLETTKGLQILIVDKRMEVKYASMMQRREIILRRPGFIPFADTKNSLEHYIKSKGKKVLKGNVFIEVLKDVRLNSDFINLFSVLQNGDYIFLSLPVAAINESANIANQFFLFTGIVTIITGTLFVFIVTSRFTTPILELNEIAQRMSRLDFSKKYRIRTHDEIGELGNSINSLSEQLHKSIHELQEANEKLKQDIEHERKIDEMRKEFISSVSHELKTPIALIQGYAEGLKVNVNENEEKKSFYCEVIIDEALKMNRLVKQLLGLVQIESGQTNLEKEVFDVASLTEQVLKKNDLIFEERNIQVIAESKDPITVNADYHKIEQILINYINNAVNHVDKEKIIKVTIEKKDHKVRISVYNSGLPIPEDCLDKIWTSFYKVDKARTRAYGGTGLGLSIVKAIQEAHQNGYGVRNMEQGVEFWFELDLA